MVFPDTPHNFPFDGLIDELSVYNRALTSEEVQRIYYTGSQGKVKMTVAKTVPDAGSVVDVAPTQFVVDFTFPVDSDSVQADDLQVNGLAADTVVHDNDDPDTATFTFVSSPVTTQGVQTIHLAENAVARATDDVALAEYQGEFRYDVTPLMVTATDPTPGSDLILEELAAPTTAVASMAGIDGGNGGWPVLYGTDPVSSNGLQLVVDEDTLFDTERSHTTEQLAFMAFDGVSSGEVAPYLRTGTVAGVNNVDWTDVELDRDYSSMVVVATANYTESSPPLVVRIQEKTDDPNVFQVRVDRADGLPDAVSGVVVHYVVVEEGVYPNMEAVRFDSTITDGAGSWLGESRNYQNSYASPVVVGQVMTANDPAFSVFWARGTDSTAAPSNSALYVGKHVGEDSNTERLAETIGYIVIEGGMGTIGGIEYLASVGADVVNGMDEGPSNYYLNLSTLRMTFNETIDASSVGVDDLQLSAGTVTSAEVLDNVTVDYTLTGVSPSLRVSMDTNAVVDEFGNPMVPFSATYNKEPAKFYVTDSGKGQMFEYGASGSSLADDSWALTTNNGPVGATANADGTRVWVLDFDMRVYVYDSDGAELGSWLAEQGKGTRIRSPNGIATDGTDIWIVDGWGTRVKRYSGAASRTSGSQVPSSSFATQDGGSGITTDGSRIWIVNYHTDLVYTYTTAGELQGDWALYSANTFPDGLTIDPSGMSNSVWVVDRGSDAVYEYDRDTGAFLGSFALAAGNTSPSGIADPPPPADSRTSRQPHLYPSATEMNTITSWLTSETFVLPLELTQRRFEPRFGTLWRNPVGESVAPIDPGCDTTWANEMRLVPLSPTDVVQRPVVTKAHIEVDAFHEIVDEEMELLDDDLLALIAEWRE